MKEYELTVLINPDLEIDLDAPLSRVRDLVKNAGGEILTEQNDGKKRLAYKINNQDFAIYVYMDVKLPAEAPLKISNTLNITDEILRYLLVKVDEKARKAVQAAREKAASREEKE